MVNKRNTIIALVVGILIIMFIIKLFIKLVPIIILLAVAYWIYKKIRPDNSSNYSDDGCKEREEFDFVDVEYKDTDKK